ncbi:MAG: hypothetical protein MZW92_72300 [Comamonadaceae bacterium]|nr:hypothetical protein [Comamonadaceae bacterium]
MPGTSAQSAVILPAGDGRRVDHRHRSSACFFVKARQGRQDHERPVPAAWSVAGASSPSSLFYPIT